MTDEEKKAYALNSVEYRKGDDLQRARAAFRGFDATAMDRQYGQSGKTPRQILAEYEAHNAEVDEVLAWLKGKLDA